MTTRDDMITNKSIQIERDEKELIMKAKAGDRDAYQQLIAKYSSKLYGYIYRVVGSHEDAEDILQESLYSAYVHIHQFRGGALFSTWLYRISINTCCKALRQRRLSFFYNKVPIRSEHTIEKEGVASVEPVAQGPQALKEAIENELKQKVRLAIARLPRKLAEVITLKELEGLSYNDISNYLGIRRGTVMSRLYRARLALAHHLKKAGLTGK